MCAPTRRVALSARAPRLPLWRRSAARRRPPPGECGSGIVPLRLSTRRTGRGRGNVRGGRHPRAPRDRLSCAGEASVRKRAALATRASIATSRDNSRTRRLPAEEGRPARGRREASDPLSGDVGRREGGRAADRDHGRGRRGRGARAGWPVGYWGCAVTRGGRGRGDWDGGVGRRGCGCSHDLVSRGRSLGHNLVGRVQGFAT